MNYDDMNYSGGVVVKSGDARIDDCDHHCLKY